MTTVAVIFYQCLTNRAIINVRMSKRRADLESNTGVQDLPEPKRVKIDQDSTGSGSLDLRAKLLARRNNKNGAGPGAKNDDGKEVNESHQVSKALARNLNIEEDLDDDGDDDSDYMDIDDESYQVMKEEGMLCCQRMWN